MRFGRGMSVVLQLGACDEPGAGEVDPGPTCFVDFPCRSDEVASCGESPTFIVPYETRTAPPCSGAFCAQGARQDCAEGTVCVEPALKQAECRPVAETCGGPEHRACPDGTVCVHRHSHGETITCAVGPWDLVGVCEPPDPGVWPCTFPLVCDLPTTCTKSEVCGERPSEIWHAGVDMCSAFCARPCTGQVCGWTGIDTCPSGAVCIETADGAECRDASETCGGPERRRCLDIERCIHRASAGPEPRLCEVKGGQLYGSCEYPASTSVPCE